jgi:hypothetical protein
MRAGAEVDADAGDYVPEALFSARDFGLFSCLSSELTLDASNSSSELSRRRSWPAQDHIRSAAREKVDKMEAATQPTQHAQYQPETVVSLLEDRKMLQSARRFRECYEHANFADRRRQRRQGCERAAEDPVWTRTSVLDSLHDLLLVGW